MTSDDYLPENRYDLTLAVNSLYGDFRDPAAPQAVLNMQALFIGLARGQGRTVLFQRDYSQRVPIADHSAQACVEGMNRALETILAQLETDLDGELGKGADAVR